MSGRDSSYHFRLLCNKLQQISMSFFVLNAALNVFSNSHFSETFEFSFLLPQDEIIFNSSAMKRTQGELPRGHYRRPSSFDPPSRHEISPLDTCPNEKGTLSRVYPSDANRLAQGPSPSPDDVRFLPRDYLSLFSSRSLVPRGLREYRVIDLRFTLVSSLWTVCSTEAANFPRRKGK